MLQLFRKVAPGVLFGSCGAVLLVICFCVLALGTFGDPRPQFELGAREILQIHRIQWDFLPIGYSALLGWCYVLGSRWGETGRHAVAMLMHVVILGFIFLALRAILLRTVTSRWAAVTAFLLSLHPELLQSLKKVKDTNETLLAVLLIVLTLIRLRERICWQRAAVAGCALAFGTLIRPNLAVMPLLLVWALAAARRHTRVTAIAISVASMIALYCALSTAFHGRPFFPQNGSYNLYAGANPHAWTALLNDRNGESSIVIDMQSRGLHVGLDWLQPANQAGRPDARDSTYRSYYRREAWRFIREHPLQMLGLSGLKLATFLRPETNRFHYSDMKSDAFAASWLVYRTLTALVVPLWILAMLRWRLGSILIIAFAVLYTLPFALVNADPDFRPVLDLVLLADMARMMYTRAGINEPPREGALAAV